MITHGHGHPAARPPTPVLSRSVTVSQSARDEGTAQVRRPCKGGGEWWLEKAVNQAMGAGQVIRASRQDLPVINPD